MNVALVGSPVVVRWHTKSKTYSKWTLENECVNTRKTQKGSALFMTEFSFIYLITKD